MLSWFFFFFLEEKRVKDVVKYNQEKYFIHFLDGIKIEMNSFQKTEY